MPQVKKGIRRSIGRVTEKLSPEERAQRKASKEYARLEKAAEIERKKKVAREKKILTFMKKTDVPYHHHGRVESLKGTVDKHLEILKNSGKHTAYEPYYWNYNSAQSSYMPLSYLGNLFRSSEFDTIYDVPLDGTYTFIVYDSGQRGLGSYNTITVEKVESKFVAPKVNPGAFPPITTL